MLEEASLVHPTVSGTINCSSGPSGFLGKWSEEQNGIPVLQFTQGPAPKILEMWNAAKLVGESGKRGERRGSSMHRFNHRLQILPLMTEAWGGLAGDPSSFLWIALGLSPFRTLWL